MAKITELPSLSEKPAINDILIVNDTSTNLTKSITAANLMNTLNVDSYGGLEDAVTAIGATEMTVVISSAQTLTGNLTIPSTLGVSVVQGGSIDGAHTLTVNGPFNAGLYQVFGSSITVAFQSGAVREVYPEWWGAVGDGITDDTTAIQAALASGVKNGHISQKTYIITSALTGLDNYVLTGEGDISVIQQTTNNTSCITFTAKDNWLIKDIKFVNTGVGDSDYGIYATTTNNAKIIRCTFDTMGMAGIWFENADDCEISRNKFSSIGHTHGMSSDIMFYSECNRNLIEGNFCHSGACHGIAIITKVSGDTAIDNKIINNDIEGSAKYGILIYEKDAGTQGVYRNIISNNSIRDITGSFLSGADKPFGAGIYNQSAEDTVISGNIIENTNIQTDQLLLAPGAIGCVSTGSCSIVGNTIRSPIWHGIFINDSNDIGVTPGSIQISGNIIHDATRNGIGIYKKSGVVITGNNIDGCAHGIHINNVADAYEHYAIIGNSIKNNSSHGINFEFGAHESIISGNLISDNGIHGIQTNDSDHGLIVGNRLYDNTTNGISIDATCVDYTITGNKVTGNTYGMVINPIAMVAGNDVSGNTTEWTGVGGINRTTVDGDATPSVLDGHGCIYIIGNTGPTIITDFNDGEEGMMVDIYFNDANTTIDFTGTNLKGNVGVDWNPAQYDSMRMKFSNNIWFCNVSKAS